MRLMVAAAVEAGNLGCFPKQRRHEKTGN